jgi:prophage antirepressor-like protein
MDKIFRNNKLNVSVRTVGRGEEVLFYAKDVAESLGYVNTRDSIKKRCGKTISVHWGEFKGVVQRDPLAGVNRIRFLLLSRVCIS